MSDRNSKVNVKSILDKKILYSPNPYEEIKLRNISNKIRKRILEQQSNNSTTITNNHSQVKLYLSVTKRDVTLPKINPHRANKPKDVLKSSIVHINIVTNDELQKELHERNIYKKFLKGKLLKLIRSSIIMDKAKLEIMVI
jgi:hypothetical protein